ncbi:hypothetical protein GCM10011346_07870 [Oceanobacillus neutriphilus]|uniref:Uncharacterized protein n=1 Tax=Oceanobacillus neutriphilus TaxID=531815 RepID=A0ABQ2NQT6_9BACI|nr:hypothetical protein GCM10011346_07870 [Oceanobacillus neutriphilus]
MKSRTEKKKQKKQQNKKAITNHLTIFVSVIANGLKAVFYFIKLFFQ